jgi:hypothetical protein
MKNILKALLNLLILTQWSSAKDCGSPVECYAQAIEILEKDREEFKNFREIAEIRYRETEQRFIRNEQRLTETEQLLKELESRTPVEGTSPPIFANKPYFI